ncbi:hypothetical protein CYY_005775 [Polysphondylium violaceum]|uniref:Uncharacterized protein n=1 Tax=Polysphondylium violaceum TaxID=133409 RepID=A0A8J4PRF8_9MYCE|nr:hypothetical protein CYY_005775 [Polysphondylium violaceum]
MEEVYDVFKYIHTIFNYLIISLNSLNLDKELCDSLLDTNARVANIYKQQCLQSDVIQLLNDVLESTPTLMYSLALKTLLTKLLKRKKTEFTSSSNNDAFYSLFKYNLDFLIKLISVIQMLVIREHQTIESDNNIQPTVLWIGISTTQQGSLVQFNRVKLVVKLGIQEACQYITMNSNSSNSGSDDNEASKDSSISLSSAYFRIIIDTDIDIESIYELVNWLKENNISIPICVLVRSNIYEKKPLEYLKLWNFQQHNSNIILSSSPLQYQYFITSMSYRSKLKANTTTTTTTTASSTKSLPSNRYIQDQYKDSQSSLENDNNDDQQDKTSDQDLTDEDSSQHYSPYQFKSKKESRSNNKSSNVETTTVLDQASAGVVVQEQSMDNINLSRSSNRFMTIKNLGKNTPTKSSSEGNSINGNNVTPVKQRFSLGSSTASTPTTPISPNMAQPTSPVSPTNNSTGKATSNDPSLQRIEAKTTTFTHSKEVTVQTGTVGSTYINIRDALDNPVNTNTTSSQSSGYGPIPTDPIAITMLSPIGSLNPTTPTYAYVVGPGVIGISFFPTAHGTYILTALINGAHIKNSPLMFHANHNGKGSESKLKKKRKLSSTPPAPKTNTLAPPLTNLRVDSADDFDSFIDNLVEKKPKLDLQPDPEETDNEESEYEDEEDEEDEDNKMDTNQSNGNSNNNSTTNGPTRGLSNIYNNNNKIEIKITKEASSGGLFKNIILNQQLKRSGSSITTHVYNNTNNNNNNNNNNIATEEMEATLIISSNDDGDGDGATQSISPTLKIESAPSSLKQGDKNLTEEIEATQVDDDDSQVSATVPVEIDKQLLEQDTELILTSKTNSTFHSNTDGTPPKSDSSRTPSKTIIIDKQVGSKSKIMMMHNPDEYDDDYSQEPTQIIVSPQEQ